MSDYLQDSIFNYKPPEDEKTKRQDFIFSYSRMSLYNECPLKYKFKYIDKIPEKPKKFLFIGRVIHSALELFFSKVPPPSLDELFNFIIKEWKNTPYDQKGYAKQEYDEIDLQNILNIMKNFYLKHQDNKKIPFLLEYSTYVTIDGYKFTIIADKIEYIGNGKIVIVDYKTGKEGDRTPHQLYFYQKICEADPIILKKIEEKYSDKLNSVEVDSMVYYYVENLKEIRYPRAKESEIKRFWDEAISVIENILSNKFDPTPSEKACKWCDYKEICEIYSSSHKSRIEELSNNYLKILDQIENLKNELQEIEIKLIEEMKKINKTEIKSNGKTIKIEKRPKIQDIIKNKDEIKKLLNDFGLYEKASKVTVSSIIEMMEDPTLPRDFILGMRRLINDEEKINIKENE